MGSLDSSDYDLLVVDEYALERSLRVERRMYQVHEFGAQLWWGIRPEGEYESVVALAEETLLLTSDKQSLKAKLAGDPVVEVVAPDSEGEFQQSVFISRHEQSGVYHALLPPLVIPRSVDSPPTSRLISVRRVLDNRLALTWLFRGELEVHWRFTRTSEKLFAKLRAERLLKLTEDDVGDFGIHGIGGRLSKVSQDPRAWQAFLEVMKALQ